MIADVRTVEVAYGICQCGAEFSDRTGVRGLRAGASYVCKCGAQFLGRVDGDNSYLIVLRNKIT